MKSSEIKEYVQKGYFHINVIFEVVGNPKEHVEKTIKLVTDRIKEEKGLIFISEEYGEPEDAGDNMWGTYCEAEILLKGLDKIAWIAFNFSPASIEIKAPTKIELKDKTLTDFIGDLIARIHEDNTKTMQLTSENKSLLLNLNALLRNTILITMRDQELDSEAIGTKIGIQGKDLEPVLEAMIKEKTITKKGSKYARA